VWYWYNTKFGCGAIITNKSGYIIDTAPIFKALRGKHISFIKYGELINIS